jgi:succinate dehydrogenase / fumarate reductase iron-sulfur subunit
MSGIILRIARGSGEGFIERKLEVEDFRSLLDALEFIRGNGESALRYRHSCHHGSCGTCGALVDGKERLMCITPLAGLGSGPVSVEPLRKTTRIGDIAVDPGPLFSEIPEDAAYLRRSEVSHSAAHPEDGGSPDWMRLENCVECGLCVSACPVTAPFVGPAALAAADWDRESRPEREADDLAFASGPRGVDACERRFACSRACPMGVYPGRRIENLRRSKGVH